MVFFCSIACGLRLFFNLFCNSSNSRSLRNVKDRTCSQLSAMHGRLRCYEAVLVADSTLGDWQAVHQLYETDPAALVASLAAARAFPTALQVSTFLYGSCLKNKKLGGGFNFLSLRVFGGGLGGTEAVRDRFAVGGRRD